MTVNYETVRDQYTANGIQVTFQYNFRLFNDTDIKVYVDADLQTLTTDYTVTGVDVATGGNVVFVTAPAADSVITLWGYYDLTQETDYVENDSFPADAHEDAMDKSYLINIRQQDEIDRSLKFPVTDTGTPSVTLPDVTTRSDKYLKFDSNGNPTTVPLATASEITFENLYDMGDVGSGIDQLAQGNHAHGDIYYTEDEVDAFISGYVTMSGVATLGSPTTFLKVDDVSEGGEIIFEGSASYADVHVDVAGNNFRIFKDSPDLFQFWIQNNGAGACDLVVDGNIYVSGSGQLINEFSTDGTLGDNSDAALPTEKAVKTYVDLAVSDVDKLDGQHGSYYLDAGNLTGTLPVSVLPDITVPISIYTAASEAIGGGETVIQTLSVATEGYPTILFCGAFLTDVEGTMLIYRDTTQLASEVMLIDETDIGTTNHKQEIVYVDTGCTGTHSYTLRFTQTGDIGGSDAATNRYIIAITTAV